MNVKKYLHKSFLFDWILQQLSNFIKTNSKMNAASPLFLCMKSKLFGGISPDGRLFSWTYCYLDFYVRPEHLEDKARTPRMFDTLTVVEKEGIEGDADLVLADPAARTDVNCFLFRQAVEDDDLHVYLVRGTDGSLEVLHD